MPVLHAPSSEILDRMPPSNIDAEVCVIGSLLLDSRFADDVATILRPSDFYSDCNRILYETMLDMHQRDRRIDAKLLPAELSKQKKLEAAGGIAHILEISSAVPVAAHCLHYAAHVRETGILRAMVMAGTEILRDAYDGDGDAAARLDRAESKILEIQDRRVGESLSEIGAAMPDVLLELQSRFEGKTALPGVPTHFPDLMHYVPRFRPGDLIVLAARPSMGKSALALQLAYAAATTGHPVLLTSLEMPRLDLCERLLSFVSQVPLHKMREGTIDQAERHEIVASTGEISQARLSIDDSPRRTMTEIAATARRLKRKGGLAMLIVDYLQLIDPENPRDPREQQVAQISKRLKSLARELAIPVLVLAQLNRQSEAQSDKRPKLSNLRESGSIEQDADVVMFVHREEYYMTPVAARDAGVEGIGELIVAKQRNGATGIVKLVWLKQFTQFASMARGDGKGSEWNPD